MSQLDLAVSRRIPLGRSVNLQVRAEAFNVFDQVSFGPPTNTLSSGLFGQPTRTLASSLGVALGKLQRRRRRFAAAEECCEAARAIVDRLVADLGDEPWGQTLARRARELIPALVPGDERRAVLVAQSTARPRKTET